MKPLSYCTGALMLVVCLSAFSCQAATGPGDRLPAPDLDPDAGTTESTTRHAIFAGGCFWCVEGVFERLAGVSDAESGYAGGSAETADYGAVSRGATDHAEVVRITYDPSRVTYGQLMRIFFATHDPTQVDRQGPDRGRQYRSAIFAVDDEQRAAAEAYIEQLDRSGLFDQSLATTVEDLQAFYPAEDYHQDFLRQNPDHPYIRQQAVPKVEKLEKWFPEMLEGDQNGKSDADSDSK